MGLDLRTDEDFSEFGVLGSGLISDGLKLFMPRMGVLLVCFSSFIFGF